MRTMTKARRVQSTPSAQGTALKEAHEQFHRDIDQRHEAQAKLQAANEKRRRAEDACSVFSQADQGAG